MKQRLQLLIALMGFFCVLGVTTNAGARSQQPTIYAKSAIAIDADSGQILYQKNANKPMAIASISKLMTVYIVHQQIAQKKLAWSDKVKITPALAKLSTAAELTNVPLKSGHSYSVCQLVNATLVASANAAALALGQKVAGTPTKFAAMMNRTARKLGITDGHFYNASGLTNKLTGQLALKNVSKNAENLLSASDVALLAKHLLQDFPRVTQITDQSSGTFYGTQMTGHNQLLADKSIAKGVKVDGLKTGTSDKAGACFVGSATQSGKHRIITVVLGARNKGASDPARFIQTAKLMRSVYTTQHPIKLKANTAIKGVGKAKVPDGKQETVLPVTKSTHWVWVKNGVSQTKVHGRYVKKPTDVQAPVKKSAKVGLVQLSAGNNRLQYIEKSGAQIVMVANKSIKKANPFVLLWRAILRLF